MENDNSDESHKMKYWYRGESEDIVSTEFSGRVIVSGETNNRLRALYSKWRGKNAPSPDIAAGFWPPLLVTAPAEWEMAENRIVYVGQETLEWVWSKEDRAKYGYQPSDVEVFSLTDYFERPECIGALMDGYRELDFSALQPVNRRGAFWTFFRRAKEIVEARAGAMTSALFTNVMRCAAKAEGGLTIFSVPGEQRSAYLQWQKGLLPAELKALKPTLILFVSGPNYDPFLEDEFSPLTWSSVPGFEMRTLARLESPELEVPAFRTYHPGYLQRSLGFAPLQAAIDAALPNGTASKGEQRPER